MKPLEEHFQNPRNAGPLAGADISVRAENPVCGDLLKLYLRLDAAQRVAAAGFQVYGCPAAIAAGSMLTELVAGLGKAELSAIDEKRIEGALGGLTAERAHVAALAADAVRAACAAFPAAGAGTTKRGPEEKGPAEKGTPPS